VRIAAKLSQEELALESGLDRTYVSMLERGIKSPTLTTVVALAEALDVPPEFLVHSLPLPTPKTTLTKMPLMATSVSCGKAMNAEGVIEKTLDLEELVTKNPGDTFYIRASGDSMSPTIQDSDWLVVDTAKKPRPGSIVLAQIAGGYTVKRLHKQGSNQLLRPDNPLHPSIEIGDTEIRLCGVIVSLVRTGL
jgi:DNA polymerase V